MASQRIPKAENCSQPNGHIFNQQIYARVRLATESDVPHLDKLIYHLALYHKLPFEATEASISNNLFKYKPLPLFESFTGLILEVSPNPFPPVTDHPVFNPVVQKVYLKEPVLDTDSEIFRRLGERNFVVTGYTLFYPHYFSFLENPGLFIDDIYTRKCYRSRGFGTMMFSVVASHAAKKGYSMVDQHVADWNLNSIKRFNKMGLQAVEDFKLYRFYGKGLQAYANGAPNVSENN